MVQTTNQILYNNITIMWYMMVAGTLFGRIYGLVNVNNPLMWVKQCHTPSP